MAGTEYSNEPIFMLKLLVDKKRERVVLAEAGKDFVDVLFSFLSLPMGTIVRLLEKYQQNQKSQAVTIGCFNNLYKSVVDISNTSFMTEARKEMLLYPRSVKENQRKRLKLNIDDIEFLKYYWCTQRCKDMCSNFPSSRCLCGSLMLEELEVRHGEGFRGCGEIFVSDKTFFTITDNMRVEHTSTGLTLKTLRELGYTDVDQLHEMQVHVNHEKVLALLQCLFSSDTPLTDVFLMKRSIYKAQNIPHPPFEEENGGEAESNKLMSLTLFTRKLDKKVLYCESGKDIVDLLFTFLVLPLISAWELSGSNIMLGCVANLCESFRNLSCGKGREALNYRFALPWYYSCDGLLLDICYANRDEDPPAFENNAWYVLNLMDPRWNIDERSTRCSGFVKKEATFMVTDDLIITPMKFSLTISQLKKWKMDLDDVEEQVIKISKATTIERLIHDIWCLELSYRKLTDKETERRETLKHQSMPPLSQIGRMALRILISRSSNFKS